MAPKPDELLNGAKELLNIGPEALNALDSIQLRKAFRALQKQQVALQLHNEELEANQTWLEASRRHLAALFDRAPVGYVVLDRTGVTRRVNQAFAQLIGREPFELTSKEFESFLEPHCRNSFTKQFKALFEDLGGMKMQVELRNADASPMWAILEILRAPTLRKSHEDEDELLVTVSDITDRVVAERALRQERRRLATTLRSIGDAVVTTDEGGRVSALNPIAQKLSGWEESEAIGKPIEQVFEVVDNEKGEPVHAPVSQALAERRVIAQATEGKLLARDGTVYQIVETAAPIIDPDRGVLGSVLVVRDVTERYERKKQLTESERQFRNLFEQSADSVFVCDPQGRIMDINRSASKVFGSDKSGLVGRNVSELHANEASRRIGLASFKAAQSEGSVHFEAEFITQSGRVFTGDVAAGLIDVRGRRFVQGVLRDVTAAKRLQEQLQEQQDKLKTILDGIPDIVALMTPDHKILAYNKAGYELLGRTPDEVEGRECYTLFGRADKCESCPVHLVRASRQPESRDVYSQDLKRWFHTTAIPIFDDSGALTMMVEQRRDITADIEARQALAESEERFRRIVDMLPQFVSYADRDLVMQFANRAHRELFEVPPEELVGRDVADVFGSAAFEEAKPYLERVLAGEATTDTFRLELSSGDREMLRQLLPDKLTSGEVLGYYAVLTDISKLRDSESSRLRLQAQALQTQKMESVSRLADGIGHEFNNLLTDILGKLSLAQLDIPPSDPVFATLGETVSAAKRASTLTHQLLLLASKPTAAPHVVDPNELIRGLRDRLERLTGDGVEIHAELGSDVGYVEIDSELLEQVFVNLVTNASEAMPEGGTLTIESESIHADENSYKARSLPGPGHYVALTIRDKGRGMDKSTLDRAFEPFFTTKPKDEAPGLGLSTVYGIVHQNKGVVALRSEVGSGTQVQVYLPRVEQPRERPAQRTSLPQGIEKVLVVEDDPRVRKMAVKILKKAGYEVLEAEDGPTAIAMIFRQGQVPDLLLTDVVMPHMTGKELADEVTRHFPAVKVLFTSGYYPEDLILEHGITTDENCFIDKPFVPVDLAKKVRNLLDQ